MSFHSLGPLESCVSQPAFTECVFPFLGVGLGVGVGVGRVIVGSTMETLSLDRESHLTHVAAQTLKLSVPSLSFLSLLRIN